MKILIVHQYFLGAESSGGSRFNELTRFWKQAGHEPVVIAGQIDYQTGRRDPRYAGHAVVEEDAGGVRVLRSWVPDAYRRGYGGRMLAFLAFTLSALWAALRHCSRPDVVVASSPPLVAAIPGILVALLWRRPLVFEVRDLWPESAVAMGALKPSGPLTQLLYGLEALAYRFASRIVVLTPAFAENISRRGLAPRSKLTLIPNGADLELFQPGPPDGALRRQLGWEGRFVALYAGAHGPANHLSQLLDAAQLLSDRPDIRIAAAGDGPEREALQAEAERRHLNNIQFLGPVPKSRMPALVRACDAGVAVLKNVETFRTVYPNKVFDYMACEKPSLIAIDGVARRLVVDEARAGVFARPESGREIAERLVELADNPQLRNELGWNGRRFVVTHYSREALAQRYLQILEDCVTQPELLPLSQYGRMTGDAS